MRKHNIFFSIGSRTLYLLLIVILFVGGAVLVTRADDIQYVYDSQNRLIEVRYSDKIIVYTYDAAGNRTSLVITNPNPVPQLSNLNPGSAVVGDAGFNLTVTGTNFLNGSTVQWNGAARTTSFVSATQLGATIDAADIAAIGTASVTVVNPAPGGGTSNALTFTITPPCDFSAFPSSQSFASGGGTDSVTVVVPNGCNWTATSNATWITIKSGNGGSGNGTVNYSVAPNTGIGRSGTMTVAGQAVTITQGAGCSLSLNANSQSFTSAGGSGSVNVSAGTGCDWQAQSNASFITISSGASGVANGMVSYSVAANHTTNSRTGTMTIAGQTVTISEEACAGLSITSQPSNQAACAGSMASFSVAAAGSNNTYHWRKGGVPLSDGGNISGAASDHLTINPTSAGDAGAYDVVVAGTCGNTMSDAVALTVNSAPAITDSPASLAKCAGQQATFSVNATGAALTYQWRKGGNPIAGATASSYSIASVSAGDAGSYDVIVSGACSPQATSMAATLTVNAAPSVTGHPSNQTACAGGSASFTATTSGSPSPTVQWQVSTDGGASFSNLAGETATTLTLTSVSASQNSNRYRAVFSNSCGTANSNAGVLTVNSFSLSASSQSFSAAGGSGSVNLIVASGCNWTADSNAGWVTITAGASGSGNGAISYSVAANTSTSTRSSTITVAGQTLAVLQGAAFVDVPANHIFYDFIGKLSARGVTQGCGSGNYCPDAFVTREQMAAFIIRARGEFNPPQPATQRFADVPPSNPFYAFIDRMAALGITSGCGGGNYCPSQPVTREQMAAFMIRAIGEFTPPVPPSQRFNDVPPSNLFYNFIDRMAVLQITSGCGGGNYCPSDNVTRGQMAVFLVRAFGL